MSFINLGGQTIHTSSLNNSIGLSNSGIISIAGSTSSSITTSTSTSPYLVWGGSTINYSINKTTYHVLGEDVQVDGYTDPSLSIAISTLNVLGKPFYDELKKNDISFPKEIEDFLDKKFKILERDRKINEVLK